MEIQKQLWTLNNEMRNEGWTKTLSLSTSMFSYHTITPIRCRYRRRNRRMEWRLSLLSVTWSRIKSLSSSSGMIPDAENGGDF